MRKRVAVFATGWGTEYLREVVSGAFSVAQLKNIDIFSFVDFSIMASDAISNLGEINIFRLPDLKDFDGVIMLTNSFNMKDEEILIRDKIFASGVPAISVEYDMEGITSINTDNYYGMYELCKHVVVEHRSKRIVYMGGPENHMESAIRLSAVKDVLDEYDIEFPESNILFGDWAKNRAKALMRQWIHKNGLPDAFICANDVMAIGAIETVREEGYSVPEDVIVTGYDCTNQGQNYIPSVSSVSHEWYSMGIKTMNALLDKMDKREVSNNIVLRTRFVCGESCGCKVDKNVTYRQVGIGRKTKYMKFEGSELDSHFRHIYLAVRKVENSSMLYDKFKELFEKEHWFEGDDFKLYLDNEFFNIVKEDTNLKSVGYDDELYAICSLKKGTTEVARKIKRKDAIFGAADESNEPGMYTFVPLSSEGKAYGFAMMSRDIDIVLENHLYSWTRHLNQYLEQARRNFTISELTRRLTELSVTDVLTDTYNRAGCETIAFPMLEELKKEGHTGVVMIADIDRMKTINDVNGHASGDKALKLVAGALKESVPDGWLVSRFGGDEFVVAGKFEEDIDLDLISDQITINLQNDIIKNNIQFDLSVSVGYALVKPSDSTNVEKSLREADKLMYFVKKIHHDEADKQSK